MMGIPHDEGASLYSLKHLWYSVYGAIPRILSTISTSIYLTLLHNFAAAAKHNFDAAKHNFDNAAEHSFDDVPEHDSDDAVDHT